MWSLKFIVLIIGGTFCFVYTLSLYMLANFFKCEQKTVSEGTATSQNVNSVMPFRSGLVEQASMANLRPPLVRFRWYTENGGPIHMG